MSDTVKDKGRVRYIEPSNICLSRDGSFSDAINFPYEDYNMAVDKMSGGDIHDKVGILI